MARLTDIAGLDAPSADALRAAGIGSVAGLLRAAASPGGRRRIASATGLDEADVLTWARRADLFRIKGVGGTYAALLEAAGVRSVPELGRQSPPALWGAIERANMAGERLAPLLPSVFTARRWVAEARRLQPVVET